MKAQRCTVLPAAFGLIALLFLPPLPQSNVWAQPRPERAAVNTGEDNMLMNKPYFTITVESEMTMGYLLFNGQLLYAAEMKPVKFDLPVNHWISKGKNELRMLLAPVDEEGNMGEFPSGMRCAMTLRVRQSGTGSEENRTIAVLKFMAKDQGGIESSTSEERLDSHKGLVPAKDGDVIIGKVKREPFQEGGAIVTREVSLPKIGLPEWKFFGSDNVTSLSGVDIEGQLDEETYGKLKQEVLPIYRKIWSALEARTVDKIMPLFEERNNEIDAAFFKSEGETGSRLTKELKERALDSTIKLYPITENNIILQVFDNNKLVRLSQNNGKALLCFDDSVNHVGYYYDVIFRKSGKKWTITR